MSINKREACSSNQNQLINRRNIFSFKMLKLIGILVLITKYGFTDGCNTDLFPSTGDDVSDGCRTKCLGHNTTLIAHQDKTKYCVCEDGKLSIKNCPKNLHVNADIYAGKTGYQVNIPDDHSLSCIGTCPVCQDPDLIILLAHKECRKYCQCDDGWPITWECPLDWHFSTEYGTCLRPDEAGCDPTNPPVKPSIKPPPIDTEGCIGTCPVDQDPDRIILLAHKECKNYCRCDNGWPILRECAQNLYFSIEHAKCVEPENAECDGTRPPVTPPSIDADGCIGTCPAWNSPDYTVHLPHKECSKFCKCNWGKPYVFECRKGLHFNPKLEVCDYPFDAKCTGIGSIMNWIEEPQNFKLQSDNK